MIKFKINKGETDMIIAGNMSDTMCEMNVAIASYLEHSLNSIHEHGMKSGLDETVIAKRKRAFSVKFGELTLEAIKLGIIGHYANLEEKALEQEGRVVSVSGESDEEGVLGRMLEGIEKMKDSNAITKKEMDTIVENLLDDIDRKGRKV